MSLKKFLCTLSGDDWGILKMCSHHPRLQQRFASIGLFVLIIFALCFTSSFFTFTTLFQSLWTGVPAGLFFAFMITNIYLLLLYTLTKNVLPHAQNKTARFFSVAARFIFIWFIAIVVSKPLEVLIFSSQVDVEISIYKKEQLERYVNVTEHFFENEITDLHASLEQQRRLNRGEDTDDIKRENLLVQRREAEKQNLISRMKGLIEHSNYYVQGIVILNDKHPLCWLITLFVMAIFTVPAYLKDFVPATNIFYNRKQNIETTLIKEEYAEFKKQYSRLFKEIHNAKLELTELFEDPPFNTIAKTDKREFKPQDTLLREIYDA